MLPVRRKKRSREIFASSKARIQGNWGATIEPASHFRIPLEAGIHAAVSTKWNLTVYGHLTSTFRSVVGHNFRSATQPGDRLAHNNLIAA